MTGAQMSKLIAEGQEAIRSHSGGHDFVALSTMRGYRSQKLITARQMRGIEMLADWGIVTDDGDVVIGVRP